MKIYQKQWNAGNNRTGGNNNEESCIICRNQGSIYVAGIAQSPGKNHSERISADHADRWVPTGRKFLEKIADYIFCHQDEMFPQETTAGQRTQDHVSGELDYYDISNDSCNRNDSYDKKGPDRRDSSYSRKSSDYWNGSNHWNGFYGRNGCNYRNGSYPGTDSYDCGLGTLSALTADCMRTLSHAYRVPDSTQAPALLVFSFDQRTGRYYSIHQGDGVILGVNNMGTSKGKYKGNYTNKTTFIGLHRQTSNLGERDLYSNYASNHTSNYTGSASNKNLKTTVISSPGEGMFLSYAWQAGTQATKTAPARAPMEINNGNIHHYRRILLLHDPSECICHGKDISLSSQNFIAQEKAGEIFAYMENAGTQDAAIVIIELP